jgi:hypothetical protein
MPKTFEQKVNKRIKAVGALAKITEPVILEEMKGGLKVTTYVPKKRKRYKHLLIHICFRQCIVA